MAVPVLLQAARAVAIQEVQQVVRMEAATAELQEAPLLVGMVTAALM